MAHFSITLSLLLLAYSATILGRPVSVLDALYYLPQPDEPPQMDYDYNPATLVNTAYDFDESLKFFLLHQYFLNRLRMSFDMLNGDRLRDIGMMKRNG